MWFYVGVWVRLYVGVCGALGVWPLHRLCVWGGGGWGWGFM